MFFGSLNSDQYLALLTRGFGPTSLHDKQINSDSHNSLLPYTHLSCFAYGTA